MFDLIGIRKQTAWYEEKANQIQDKNCEMLIPMICDAIVEICYATALVKTAVQLCEINFDLLSQHAEEFGKTINTIPLDARWFPLEIKNDDSPAKPVRSFNGIFYAKK